ncbi:hypothetical protein HDU83_006731 [Entophlyctis luteolus]|nr:hypothetical protein HDU83_006731 [Entophlyctis luteolus]
MAKLYTLKASVEKCSGIFNVTVAANQCISSVECRNPQIDGASSNLYQDLAIMDGTFNVDRQDHTLIITTIVDLPYLALVGLTDIGTGITDEGAAFVLIGQTLFKNHQLCVKHYTDRIFAASPRMAGNDHSVFISDMNKFLYHDVPNFDQSLVESRSKFLQWPAAVKFIDGIAADKLKVCRTFTQKNFNATLLHQAMARVPTVASK